MEYSAKGAGEPVPYLEMALGLWFPMEVEATGAAPGLADEYKIVARLSLSPTAMDYRLNALLLHTEDGSHADIDATSLRQLSVTTIRDGIVPAVEKTTDQLADGERSSGVMDLFSPRRVQGEMDERLVEVARIYVRERLSGRRPAKGVREQMKVPSSTATYWVRRAKDLGYIAIAEGMGSDS